VIKAVILIGGSISRGHLPYAVCVMKFIDLFIAAEVVFVHKQEQHRMMQEIILLDEMEISIPFM